MATQAERYNGWTNYETWNLSLWIDNDQMFQETWKEQTDDCLMTHGEDLDAAKIDLADTFKEWVAEHVHETLGGLTSGFVVDMVSAAVSEINFYEIAEHWIDEAASE